MKKDSFVFAFFDELQIGDVFKFSPIIDDNIPSIFFTVYQKDEQTTKFNSTYGKTITRMEFINNQAKNKEIMIFQNRKRYN